MAEANKENATKPKAKKSGYEVPWIEKYRPEKLEDVVGNEETLVRLQSIAKDGNLPNLILCGPPGTGKVRTCGAEDINKLVPFWFMMIYLSPICTCIFTLRLFFVSFCVLV